jgi:flagellar hook-associated protein 3 FlgL
VLDSAQWVPDNYTLTFTSPTNYQITDNTTGTTVVANGTYTSGTAIQFNGVEVTVTGTPAAGIHSTSHRAATRACSPRSRS